MTEIENNRLYNQVLDCNTCKNNQGIVCTHCTEAMEQMRGDSYPVLNMHRLRLKRKLDVFLLRQSQIAVNR